MTLYPPSTSRDCPIVTTKVASIPSFSVGTSISKRLRVRRDKGHFIMKLKIGSSGSQQEMLEKDLEFLTQVHELLKDRETPYTKNGKIPYYFRRQRKI